MRGSLKTLLTRVDRLGQRLRWRQKDRRHESTEELWARIVENVNKAGGLDEVEKQGLLPPESVKVLRQRWTE